MPLTTQTNTFWQMYYEQQCASPHWLDYILTKWMERVVLFLEANAGHVNMLYIAHDIF